MSRRKRRPYLDPFDVKIEHLAKKGMGVGTAPDGKPVWVKPAPPGATLHVHPMGFRKGKWQARRLHMVEAPPHATTPPCPVFGLCGGCVLQEITLPAQREAKHEYALKQVAEPRDVDVETLCTQVQVHPMRGSEQAFRYRNKVELSFGVRRYLSEADNKAGFPIAGRFLGFHAPGRFDRVVDTDQCWLISEAANALLFVARQHTLHDQAPPPWDVRSHEGFWRHLMIRQGFATGQLLLTLFTASAPDEAHVQAVHDLARALQQAPLPEGHRLVGVVWMENDDIADVARGKRREVWGQDTLEEHLRHTHYQLSPRSFFQTSTAGAVILYDTIRDAILHDNTHNATILYDLYSGIGSIGLYLAEHFEQIIGIEEIEDAVLDARTNATRNGIHNTQYQAAKVEKVLEQLPRQGQDIALVVDPPRAGLHPKVAATLAQAEVPTLVYVACEPKSLGRDAALLEAGGWKLTDLWTVDLFPQTGHIEMVGRFTKTPAS